MADNNDLPDYAAYRFVRNDEIVLWSDFSSRMRVAYVSDANSNVSIESRKLCLNETTWGC